MAAAAVSAPARARSGSRGLFPQWAARLIGLAALAMIGAFEWQNLVRDLPSGRVLLWAVASVSAATAVLLVTREPTRRPPPVRLFGPRRSRDDVAAGVSERRRAPRGLSPRARGAALFAVVVLSLFVGYALSERAARIAQAAALGRPGVRARRRAAGPRDGPAPVRQRRPVAADRARVARQRAADPGRAADLLAAGVLGIEAAGAAGRAGARVSVRRAGGADHRHRVAGHLVGRHELDARSGWPWPRCRSASCGSSGSR